MGKQGHTGNTVARNRKQEEIQNEHSGYIELRMFGKQRAPAATGSEVAR